MLNTKSREGERQFDGDTCFASFAQHRLVVDFFDGGDAALVHGLGVYVFFSMICAFVRIGVDGAKSDDEVCVVLAAYIFTFSSSPKISELRLCEETPDTLHTCASKG